MEVEHGDIDVVEQLRVELDRVARREENDDLLFAQILLQEREEQQEPLVRLADHIALLKALDGGGVAVLLDIDVQRVLAERHARQVLDLGRLCRREK